MWRARPSRTPIDRFLTGAALATAIADAERHADQPTVATPEKSIAVLPFASMSTDPENEFFADGITEELLNMLSQIGELRVAGRTSSFSFKGKNVELKQIGETLNVRTVLEGSVRRAGNRVRITAQLIDVTDGFQLWSERYDRDIEDVFAVQDEIATAIAGRLKTTLSLGREARSQRATDNIEAYAAYLKGRALLYRRAAAIKQAIRFGPDLAETHGAEAQFSLLFEWDWASAERSFLRALEINPGYGQASAWYHLFYTGLAAGMWKESEEALIAGYERDPRSAYLASIVGVLMAAYRTDDEVERWVAKADELDSGAFLSIWLRQLAMCAMRDWPRAERASEVAHAASGRTSLPLIVHGLALATAGNLDGARSIYDELRARARREYIAPSHSRCSRRRSATTMPRSRTAARLSQCEIRSSSSLPVAGRTPTRYAPSRSIVRCSWRLASRELARHHGEELRSPRSPSGWGFQSGRVHSPSRIGRDRRLPVITCGQRNAIGNPASTTDRTGNRQLRIR